MSLYFTPTPRAYLSNRSLEMKNIILIQWYVWDLINKFGRHIDKNSTTYSLFSFILLSSIIDEYSCDTWLVFVNKY